MVEGLAVAECSVSHFDEQTADEVTNQQITGNLGKSGYFQIFISGINVSSYISQVFSSPFSVSQIFYSKDEHSKNKHKNTYFY